MATDTHNNYKKAFGVLYSEISEIRKKLGMSHPDEGDIFALQNGIEPVINKYLYGYDLVSQQQIDDVVRILEKQSLETFKGFYNIERQLKGCGICRGTAHAILTYLKARGSFRELILKMDSEHSPVECRTFELPMLGNRVDTENQYPVEDLHLKYM
jgi:hypothetical protein